MNYGDNDENIRLEIHTKVWTENLYEITNLFGLEILTQERSTLFANKLIDITNSKALVNRDLYDINFYFFRDFPINQLLIQERTDKKLREYLIYLLDFINKKINSDNVLDGFEELLEEEQKIFIQQKLFDDVVRILQSKISDI